MAGHLWAGAFVMEVVKRFYLELCLLLSEIEARLSIPTSPIRIRKFFLRRHAGVKFEQHLWIGRGFRLVSKGNLVLGERCAIGAFSRIENSGPITIGDDFLAASGLTLVSGTHDVETLKPIGGKIAIGDRVWCGVNVTILSGVTIGSDVVLGAGCVVIKDIPANSVVVGIPGKVVKTLNRSSGNDIWSVFR